MTMIGSTMIDWWDDDGLVPLPFDNNDDDDDDNGNDDDDDDDDDGEDEEDLIIRGVLNDDNFAAWMLGGM